MVVVHECVTVAAAVTFAQQKMVQAALDLRLVKGFGDDLVKNTRVQLQLLWGVARQGHNGSWQERERKGGRPINEETGGGEKNKERDLLATDSIHTPRHEFFLRPPLRPGVNEHNHPQDEKSKRQ